MSLNGIARRLVQHYPIRKGKGRVVSFARRRISGVVLERDEYGNRFLLDLDNYVDSMIFLEGAYERENMLQLKKWADHQDRCILLDIGANIGSYTIALAAHPNVDLVHAFEPVPRNIAQLQANVWLNDRCGRVRVHDVALSDHNGESQMHVPRTVRQKGAYQYNTSASSLDCEAYAESEQIPIQLRRLDDLLCLNSRNAIIKLDVEGHEEAVLRGMERSLRENNCVVLIEIWKGNFERIHQLLHNYGFVRRECSLWGENYLYENSKSLVV